MKGIFWNFESCVSAEEKGIGNPEFCSGFIGESGFSRTKLATVNSSRTGGKLGLSSRRNQMNILKALGTDYRQMW